MVLQMIGQPLMCPTEDLVASLVHPVEVAHRLRAGFPAAPHLIGYPRPCWLFGTLTWRCALPVLGSPLHALRDAVSPILYS